MPFIEKGDEMKIIVISILALMVMAGTGYAGQLQVEGTADGLTLNVQVENEPLKVGDNAVSIVLISKDGNSISDAEVSVYYFMPVMPAMNYEVNAVSEDNKYTAMIKPTMPGEWEAAVKVKSGSKEAQKVTFNFEAE